eukprot:scaffold8867_cov118-Isochrysis_galbana.AAC.1
MADGSCQYPRVYAASASAMSYSYKYVATHTTYSSLKKSRRSEGLKTIPNWSMSEGRELCCMHYFRRPDARLPDCQRESVMTTGVATTRHPHSHHTHTHSI